MSLFREIGMHAGLGRTLSQIGTERFWKQLVLLLHQCLPCDNALAIFYPVEGPPQALEEYDAEPSSKPASMLTYLNGLYLLDPFYIASREHSRTGLFRLAEVAPEHFELTEYYQRYFRVNVVADEIQFNCQLEGERTLCLSLGSKQPFNAQQIALLSLIQPWVLGLLRQRLPYEINEVVALAPAPMQGDWRVQLEASVQQIKGAQLTARELDVGRLMLSGCSSKEIARKLEISIETVKVHKKHMYSKLGIKSQSELFSIFLQAQNA